MRGIPGLAEKGIYRDAIQMLLQCPHKISQATEIQKPYRFKGSRKKKSV